MIVSAARRTWNRLGPAWAAAWSLSILVAVVSPLFRTPTQAFSALSLFASLLFGLVAWLFLGITRVLARGKVSGALVSLVLGIWTTFFLVANAVVFQEFGEFTNGAMIAYLRSDKEYLVRYFSSYLSPGYLVLFLLACALATAGWWKFGTRNQSSPTPRKTIALASFGTGILVLSLVGVQLALLSPERYLLPESSFSLAFILGLRDAAPPTAKLHSSKRLGVHGSTTNHLPNVLLIINETWHAIDLKFDDPTVTSPTMPLLNGWIEEHADRCVVFRRAYANSNCTDVSVPSILTGVAPELSSKKLHRAPLAWDWAHANDMYTLLGSSQVPLGELRQVLLYQELGHLPDRRHPARALYQ